MPTTTAKPTSDFHRIAVGFRFEGPMLDSDTPQQPDTSQPAAAPSAPAAPTSIPDGAAVMQGIIDAHNKPSEPQPTPTPDPTPQPSPADASALGDPQFGEYAYPTSEYTDVVAQILAENEAGAYGLGAAILSQMPGLLIHHADYVLSVLGYDSASVARQAQEIESAQRVDHESTRTIASETRALYNEFVEMGSRLGLSPLEARGLAATAYEEFEAQYWDDKSEWRKTHDDWYNRIKGGNELHAGDGRKAFQKAFEAAYRRAAEAHGVSAEHFNKTNKAPREGESWADWRARQTGAGLMREMIHSRGLGQQEAERPAGDPTKLHGANLMEHIIHEHKQRRSQ
jgi:hypothetical protein